MKAQNPVPSWFIAERALIDVVAKDRGLRGSAPA